MLFLCGRECVLHSDLCKKHLMEEKLKGRNAFSITSARLCSFWGKLNVMQILSLTLKP